jgi:rare lipoprotein A
MALVLERSGARAPHKAYLTLFLAGLCCLSLASCGVSPVLNYARTQEGLASYYSNDFQGRKTSSGELFDNSKFTAAHRAFPFGTLVRVTNLDNQAQVEVRINDRGPRQPERIIDLSMAAAKALHMVQAGLAHVRVEVLQMGG